MYNQSISGFWLRGRILSSHWTLESSQNLKTGPKLPFLRDEHPQEFKRHIFWVHQGTIWFWLIPWHSRLLGASGQRWTRAADGSATLFGSSSRAEATAATIGSAVLRWQSAIGRSAGQELKKSGWPTVLGSVMLDDPVLVWSRLGRHSFGDLNIFLSCSLSWWSPAVCLWRAKKR